MDDPCRRARRKRSRCEGEPSILLVSRCPLLSAPDRVGRRMRPIAVMTVPSVLRLPGERPRRKAKEARPRARRGVEARAGGSPLLLTPDLSARKAIQSSRDVRRASSSVGRPE